MTVKNQDTQVDTDKIVADQKAAQVVKDKNVQATKDTAAERAQRDKA
jgi:hypothetical protein